MKKLLLIFLTALSLSGFGQASVITFEDKDKTIPAPSVRRLVRDVDLNEIKNVVNQHAGLIDDIESGGQPVDSDLTAISGLSPSNDDVIQRKSGVWVNRTLAQIKADLLLNLVDNTSDASKPVSTAQQTALNLKANIASPTFTTGITTPLVKITSGSPGSGKVLTSDADGDGSWSTPSVAASGITGTLGIANGGNGTTNGISAETQAALNLKTTTTSFAVRVTPTGTINGVNTVFTFPNSLVDGSEHIYVNGILQEEGVDYSRVTTTVTFAVAPETGDDLKFSYIRP
jgi:hypothetical protein